MVLFIYPTETAYGLGCDATNQRDVDKIFKIKRRPRSMTLPLIASSLAMVRRYCVMSRLELKLAKDYWPGPLTMILKISERRLANGVVAKDGTVAIRVSSHPIARALSRKLGRPIVSTSANLSGAGEYYSIADVKRNLAGSIRMIEPAIEITVIDGGVLPKRKPSTIIRVVGEKIEVVRIGKIRISKFEIRNNPPWADK